ncbi:RHS repeat-associated core domain-containing protein [Rapidithrix thailandica]|uniref:RHS repeat-associated core domain-containing protein n=1 Tax=Rapidithrix thailandica TaxID=413964 RepID=A0AAW9SK72_9BACT
MVYGKVAKGEDFTEYRYDASGNRVYKGLKVGAITKMTHYVRGALDEASGEVSGNVLAIYKDRQVSEQPMYGSSRVGLFRRSIQPEGQAEESQPQAGELALGHRQYELSNHLGNVLATITDRVKYKDNRRASEVLSASDYFPFGKQMAGRNYSDENYRYGFNGKENDKDFGNQHLIQDYGFRLYNPKIGKFLSVDPLAKDYPGLTPYQFASNNPIYNIDLDGLEGMSGWGISMSKTGTTEQDLSNSGKIVVEIGINIVESSIDGPVYTVTSVGSGLANGFSYGYGDLLNGNGSATQTYWKPWGFKFSDGFYQEGYSSGNDISFDDGLRLMGGTIDIIGLGLGLSSSRLLKPNMLGQSKSRYLLLQDDLDNNSFSRIFDAVKKFGPSPMPIPLEGQLTIPQARQLMDMVPDKEIALIREISEDGLENFQLYFGTKNRLRFQISESGKTELIFHTHPSGNPIPSKADIEILKILNQDESVIIPYRRPEVKFNKKSKTLN